MWPKMQRHEFHQLIDEFQTHIEDEIDNLDQDLDFDNESGTLTIYCVNQSQVIISRQSATNQLWIAAKSGGFHFDYDKELGQWLDDKNGESAESCVNRVLTEQNPRPVEIFKKPIK